MLAGAGLGCLSPATVPLPELDPAIRSVALVRVGEDETGALVGGLASVGQSAAVLAPPAGSEGTYLLAYAQDLVGDMGRSGVVDLRRASACGPNLPRPRRAYRLEGRGFVESSLPPIELMAEGASCQTSTQSFFAVPRSTSLCVLDAMNADGCSAQLLASNTACVSVNISSQLDQAGLPCLGRTNQGPCLVNPDGSFSCAGATWDTYAGERRTLSMRTAVVNAADHVINDESEGKTAANIRAGFLGPIALVDGGVVVAVTANPSYSCSHGDRLARIDADTLAVETSTIVLNCVTGLLGDPTHPGQVLAYGRLPIVGPEGDNGQREIARLDVQGRVLAELPLPDDPLTSTHDGSLFAAGLFLRPPASGVPRAAVISAIHRGRAADAFAIYDFDLRTLTLIGAPYGSFGQPTGASEAPGGALAVADDDGDCVQFLSPAGSSGCTRSSSVRLGPIAAVPGERAWLVGVLQPSPPSFRVFNEAGSLESMAWAGAPTAGIERLLPDPQDPQRLWIIGTDPLQNAWLGEMRGRTIQRWATRLGRGAVSWAVIDPEHRLWAVLTWEGTVVQVNLPD